MNDDLFDDLFDEPSTSTTGASTSSGHSAGRLGRYAAAAAVAAAATAAITFAAVQLTTPDVPAGATPTGTPDSELVDSDDSADTPRPAADLPPDLQMPSLIERIDAHTPDLGDQP